MCPLPKPQKAAEQAPATAGQADVSTLSAMLSARWKQGQAAAGQSAGDPPRAGQIRNFRIAALDPAAKRIELELAG